MVDFLKANWTWLSSNPVGVIGLFGIGAGFGWAAAKAIYHERIEVLKERSTSSSTETPKPTQPEPVAFTYPNPGRHGLNVLSNAVHEVTVGDAVSVAATIPAGQTLRIALEGPGPRDLGDMAAWTFSVIGVQNWVKGKYDEPVSESVARQLFTAHAGDADMQFHFRRAGEVTIQVFEGEARDPTWTKRLRVNVSE